MVCRRKFDERDVNTGLLQIGFVLPAQADVLCIIDRSVKHHHRRACSECIIYQAKIADRIQTNMAGKSEAFTIEVCDASR